MAKKSLDPVEFNESADSQEESSSDGRLHITDEVRKSIQYVVDKTNQLKLAKEAIKDDVTAIAAKMGCKPAQVTGIINLVIKEQEKGGVLIEEEQRLSWTREVLEKMALAQPEE